MPRSIIAKHLRKIFSIFTSAIVLSMLISTIFPITASTSTQDYPSNVKVNQETITSDWPALSMDVDDEGTIYILWNDKIDDDDRQNNLYISKSTDGGWTYSNLVQINDVNGSVPQHVYAEISAKGNGKIFTVWLDGRIEGNGTGDIYFDRSLDGGMTFGNDLRVNEFTKLGIEETPSIAADDDGNAYVVWEDHRNNDAGDVYFSKLSAGSSNFSENICVNDDPGAHQQSGAAITLDDEGTIYVAWTDLRDYGAIYFSKSTDNGNSFNKDVKVCSGGIDIYSINIAAYKNSIYIVYHNESNPGNPKGMYFVKSEDNGASWKNVIVLRRNIMETKHCVPSLIVDNKGTIYVAWPENNSRNYDIIIAKSTDGGESWTIGTSTDINTNKVTRVASFTDKNDNLYIAWVELAPDYSNDIYFSKINPATIVALSKEDDQSSGFATIIIVPIALIIIAFIIIVSTEVGRFALIKTVGAPFYSRIKKGDVLNHNLRNRLFSHINSYPGHHFKSLQKSFHIGSGSLAYHLSVLERGGYITSRRDGYHKRFYPGPDQHSRVTTDQMVAEGKITINSPADVQNNVKDDIQEQILATIRANPGITQKQLGELVGLSTTGINYHVNIMANAQVIRVIRDGKWTRCYLAE